MAGAKRVLSSPDSSDREDSRGPVKHSKNTSHDNEARVLSKKRRSRPSKKQQVLDDNNQAAQQRKIERLQKQLAKYERQRHKVNAAGRSTTSEAPFSFDGMPPESEDGTFKKGESIQMARPPAKHHQNTFVNEWALLGPPPHAAPPTSNTQLGDVDPAPSTGPGSMPLLRVAEFRNNQPPSGRPKAQDYKDEVKELLIRAIREFEWRIYTINPFPDAEQQATWAQEAWNTACRVRNGTHTYELTERMMTIIKARKSNTRSDIIKAVRPIVQQTYGFINTGDKKSDQARENIRIYLRLMDDSMFLYKDNGDTSGERSGYAEHPIVSKLIYTCFFTDKNAVGIQYPRHFDPIGLTTLALIFAAIEHSIEEWSSGVQFKVAFREEDTKTTFQSYRKGLQNWEALDKGITRKIRKKWHDRARRASGAPTNMESITSNISSAALEQAKKHLQGRSGETDSEAE
ncbi:hypothetical protein B0H21DRAFT_708439 [Amylocystis lapponica]|nr:hypothetical protein B0H21DRAFT_708439 [Amylocystis lapponica]